MGNYAIEYYGAAAVFPAENEVLDGVDYGPTGADFTGTVLIGAGVGYPAVGNVRLAVVYGESNEFIGTLALPTVGQVESGVGYGASGTEFTGTLVAGSSGDSVVAFGNLVLVQGDTYDGIANPLLTWTTTADYTDGWSVMFTIRDKDDVVVYQQAGVVVNATTITVDIDAPTGLAMVGCPGSWQGKFDVELSKGVVPNRSVKTIASGVAYINEDQTR